MKTQKSDDREMLLNALIETHIFSILRQEFREGQNVGWPSAAIAPLELVFDRPLAQRALEKIFSADVQTKSVSREIRKIDILRK